MFDLATRRIGRAFLPLTDRRMLVISPDGHYSGLPASAEEALVYIIKTPKGQETLSPAEFAARFGWRNAPGVTA